MLLPMIEKKVQMMEILKLVTLLLIYDITGSSTQSLPCRTPSGDNCTSSICPNTVVNYTCTIPSGTPGGLTDWTLPTGTCPSNSFPNKIRISQLVSQLCAHSGSISCGPYTASSGPASGATYCLSSILTVNITAAMNGSTVTCNNTNVITPSISTVVSLATINVVGPPGAPNVNMAKTIGPDMVLVVVNPSSSGGLPTNYNVTIRNSSNVSTKSTPAFLNGSAMVTFTGLTNTATYTISAVAINCAGSSNPSTTISVSWPAPTTSPLPSLATNTASPPTTPTQNPTPDPNIGIKVGIGIGVVFLVVLIVISIVISVFLCIPSNGSKPDQIDASQGTPSVDAGQGPPHVDAPKELLARAPHQDTRVPEEPLNNRNNTQPNRVPDEALYDGGAGLGGMAPTGRGQEAQYSVPDEQMYANVQADMTTNKPSRRGGKGPPLPPRTG